MKRMALFAASLLGGLLIPSGSIAHAEELDAVEIEKSVVWVDVVWKARVFVPGKYFDDRQGSYLKTEAEAYTGCTGWFVSDSGDIVTAGHCVNYDEDVRARLINNLIDETGLKSYRADAHRDWQVRKADLVRSVRVGQPQGLVGAPLEDDSIIAQVIAAQPFDSGDNALLRVADMDSTGLPIATEAPEIGDTVTAIGFSGSVSSVSDVRRQRPSFKEGSVSSRQYTQKGVPNTEIDAVVSGGMSGGPTIDETGAVIGVNSFRVSGETQPINFVTDGQTLKRFLTSKGVTPEELSSTISPSPTPSESGSASPSAVPTDQTDSAEDQEPTEQPADNNDTNLMVIGLTIVIVLLLVLLAIVLLRGRRRSKATP